MDVRYYIDTETGLPHIHGHGVAAQDVEDVLRRPMEDRPIDLGAAAHASRSVAAKRDGIFG